MSSDTNWSLKWNEREGQYIARYRKFPPPAFGSLEDAWGTKRIPKTFARHQQLDAERWMISWYSQLIGTGGLNVAKANVEPVKKTLRLLGPRWLKYRYDDPGTKINTYNGLKQALNNWIFDSDRFEHAKLDTLDMERDFTGEVCLAWIHGIPRETSSVLSYTFALSTLFNDCIALGWLNPDMANPFERPAVKKTIGKMMEASKKERVVTYLSVKQVVALLTEPTRKVTDFRRVRYVLTLATGLRDHEVQGLIWTDFNLDAPIPHLVIDRQLDKIGTKPFLSADDLARKGMTKDDIVTVPNALVSPPKKNSRRVQPLLPLVVAVMKWWRSTGWKVYVGRAPAKDDPVFPSGRTNRHSPAGQFALVESAELLRADLLRVGQEASFSGIDFDYQALRRTFATQLNINGVSEAEVGDLLGHGARSVARGHYISSELLGRRMELLRRLPLPELVQLQGKVIEVPKSERLAEVIRLPVGPSRR